LEFSQYASTRSAQVFGIIIRRREVRYCFNSSMVDFGDRCRKIHPSTALRNHEFSLQHRYPQQTKYHSHNPMFPIQLINEHEPALQSIHPIWHVCDIQEFLIFRNEQFLHIRIKSCCRFQPDQTNVHDCVCVCKL
jgi:hypothetical protein